MLLRLLLAGGMIEASAISHSVPLPAAPDGWFDYGFTALADGRLALVRTQREKIRGHNTN